MDGNKIPANNGAQTDSIRVHEKHARDYDNQVTALDCHDHALLFGLGFGHVNPGDHLLDLGIGTGLGSELFHRAGLVISGIDGCAPMLEQCRGKKKAGQLLNHDLSRPPYPWPDASFDHALACGVCHFFKDPGIIFNEVFRLIRPGGVFAFTIQVPQDGGKKGEIRVESRMMEKVAVYSHSDGWVDHAMAHAGFIRLKQVVFYLYPRVNPHLKFRACLVQKPV